MNRAALAACLAAALLAAGCTGGHDEPAPTPSTGRSGTAAIKPVNAVLPGIEAFVAKTRGLKFKHPVRVSLLGRRAFLKKLHADQHEPKALEVEKETAVLSALGLVSPRVNLVDAFKTAYDAGVLGFYSAKRKRLFVKGRQATPGVRAVLSHELTHALTDQWFGIDRPKLDKSNQELGIGFTALIEGDAERTRKAYEATLSSADRAAAERQQGGDQQPPDVPQVVLELIGFPYAIGPTFVDAVVSHGGLHALNHAYRRPPTSSEQLVAPDRYFAGDDPKHVAVPPADGPKLEHGDLGVLGLALMFEHRLGQASIQGALTGWGGDQFVAWRAGNHRWCLRDTVVMESATDALRFDTILGQWIRAMRGRARIEHEGVPTTFRTCSS